MEFGAFQAEEFGDLQRLGDGRFYDRHAIDRLELIVQAEILDLAPDLMEIVNLLPPGYYDRQSLCDQLNSALAAHGWGAVYATVDLASRPSIWPVSRPWRGLFRACGQKRANMSTVTFLVAAIFGRNRQNWT